MNASVLERIRGLRRLDRALKLVWASARSWTMASLALIVIQALLPLAVLYLVKLTIDAVATGVQAADKTAALQEILLLVLLTGLITLLIAACRTANEVVQQHQSQLVTDQVTDIIHHQSAAVDLAYYEDSRYHDTFTGPSKRHPSARPRLLMALPRSFKTASPLSPWAGF